MLLNKVSKLCILLTISSCTTTARKEITLQKEEPEPLSIILMIGDGMRIPQVSSAFYFGEKKQDLSNF